jgi:hypothetical protein
MMDSMMLNHARTFRTPFARCLSFQQIIICGIRTVRYEENIDYDLDRLLIKKQRLLR